jgi:hypothetical protein
VGTALRALLSTALARSGISRRARASHSSTERGITSTARARRIRASVAEDSRLSSEVRYPLGSTDVEVPEDVDVPVI